MILSAVFDTNVIVSGVLSPTGAPGKVLDAILDGCCHPVVSDAILAEYEDVLSRPKFHLPADKVRLLLAGIRIRAHVAPFASVANTLLLPDPDDALFIEAALVLRVPIVTGNGKHFPRAAVQGLSILTPAAFLARLAR
jgi:putative PIN family toxin of toxin-antitoxin system